MILMGANSFEGHWKGWVLKGETSLVSEMATCKASVFCQAIEKNRYIGNFM